MKSPGDTGQQVVRTVLRAAQDGRLTHTEQGRTWLRPRSSAFEPTEVTDVVASLAGEEPPLVRLGDRDGAWLRTVELTEAGRELLTGKPKPAAVVDGYELVLERRDQADGTAKLGGGAVLMTPMVDDDYWSYRVQVSPTQAIVAFPKFSTIGVGFAVEEDWNTNLPYTVGAERIWEHIEHNKGDESIPDERCLAALRLIVDAVRADRGER